MEYGTNIAILVTIFVLGGLISLFFLAFTENPIIGGIVFFLTCVVLAFAGVANYKSTATQVELTVAKQERVVSRDGKSAKYLVFTKAETFENTDSFLAFGKTNSSDLYGRLDPGHKYSCKVAGWRVQLFSSYRNLISCNEIK